MAKVDYIWDFDVSPPSAAYMRQWTRSALVREMACRLFGASYYLNQCCFINNWILRNKFQWNFNQNTYVFIHKMHLKMSWYDGHFVNSKRQSITCPDGRAMEYSLYVLVEKVQKHIILHTTIHIFHTLSTGTSIIKTKMGLFYRRLSVMVATQQKPYAYCENAQKIRLPGCNW